MSRLWPVVRREYLERVRSRAFLVATILGPLLMAAFTVVPGLVMAKQRGGALRVVVLDASGSLREPVEQALAAKQAMGEPRFLVRAAPTAPLEEARTGLRRQVLEGSLDGYVFLPVDALDRSAVEYYGKNVSNIVDLELMQQAVEEALVGVRLSSAGLAPDRVRLLTRKVDFKTLRLSEGGVREDRGGSFLFSTILMMMLYVAVAMWGQAIMTGVIEEKTSRVVEVVVSSISAGKLLAGKLLGVGAAGLTQFLVWAGTLAAISLLGARMMPPGALPLPEVTPLVLVALLVYFLLGYFLYAALYASIGAAVNTVQEAQSLVFPVFLPLVTAVMLFPAVLRSPDSAFSTVASLIPFFTPILMFLRITVLAPPAWQIALSIVLTLGTIAGITWAAARIYRVGILMYGKRPTLPEILRWVSRA